MVALLYQYEVMEPDTAAFLMQSAGAIATRERTARPVGPIFGLATKMSTGKPLLATEVAGAIQLLRKMGPLHDDHARSAMLHLTNTIQDRCRANRSLAIEGGGPDTSLVVKVDHMLEPSTSGESSRAE
jgi:hypothetical protein